MRVDFDRVVAGIVETCEGIGKGAGTPLFSKRGANPVLHSQTPFQLVQSILQNPNFFLSIIIYTYDRTTSKTHQG
jgi:hypothetical protein